MTTSGTPFVGHLDCMSVTKLVRCESAPDAGFSGRVMQLLTSSRGFPVPSGGRSVDHTEQRPDRQLAADLEPRVELLPRPAVHPDLASLAALPPPHEDGASSTVKVALVEGERFADSQARTPQQHDQRPQAVTVGAIIDCAHDRDDFLDCGGSAGYCSPLLRGGRPR